MTRLGKARRIGGFAVAAALAATLGCGSEGTTAVAPALVLGARSVDFGLTRVGARATRRVALQSVSARDVTVTRVELEEVSGAAAFGLQVAPQPLVVGRDAGVEIAVTFAPASEGDFSAVLVIESDDPDPADSPARIELWGTGENPAVRVLAECKPPCALFAATEEPPAIDFGARRPLKRDASGAFVDEPAWPTVTLLNDGLLPLRLERISFEGDAAFSARESLDVAGVEIDPAGGQVLHVRFSPRAGQGSYAGALVIATDDPAHPEVRVALRGTLAPDEPPQVCAAIVRVEHPDGSVEAPRDAGGREDFFGTQPPVQPGANAVVFLSAFSDHFVAGLHPDERTRGDLSKCTTDAADGRDRLSYRWSVVQRPVASVAELGAAGEPEPTFRPDAIGAYRLRLEVTDTDGNRAHADVEFVAMPRRDLVAQLSWGERNVDLDLHLVRPGANCNGDCVFDARGDLNGYSRGTTATFDWGVPGDPSDDPRLDWDDRGAGARLETVTLNAPGNDPACRSGPCTYDVYVHYFEDWRSDSGSQPACPGTPCREGARCGCAADRVCVSGRCVTAARPALSVWLEPQAGSSPALTLPLPAEDFAIAGPCFLWHAARIEWRPDGTASASAAGASGTREFSYYGRLAEGSFACQPNGTPGMPSAFVPGTIPEYN